MRPFTSAISTGVRPLKPMNFFPLSKEFTFSVSAGLYEAFLPIITLDVPKVNAITAIAITRIFFIKKRSPFSGERKVSKKLLLFEPFQAAAAEV